MLQRRVGERESAALSLGEYLDATATQVRAVAWRRERREMHALAHTLPTKWPAGDLAIGEPRAHHHCAALVRSGVPSRASAASCRSRFDPARPPCQVWLGRRAGSRVETTLSVGTARRRWVNDVGGRSTSSSSFRFRFLRVALALALEWHEDYCIHVLDPSSL